MGIPVSSVWRPSARQAAVLLALLLAAWVLTTSGAALAGRANGADSLSPPVVEESTDHTNCTVVYAADGSTALGGNNEDGRNPLSKIWFVPGEDGSYGSMFVGYDDLVIQGGMNEAGLFFDGLAVRDVDVPAKAGKPTYTGQGILAEVMSDCDSVPCVLERFGGVSMPGTWNGQYLFGDRLGDSAIMEPLTVIPKSDRFQVATNFFQSEIPPTERTDSRYVTATGMLATADAVSATVIRDVLDATHQEGTAETVYSTVYDLQSTVVHLYYFHDFAAEATFDLRAELEKGIHEYDMAALFASNRAAAELAAPIREQVAAAVGQLPAVRVDPDDLASLAGTYEAPFLSVIVKADDDGLLARQPRTPWVRLVALSRTEFARVFSDGGGAVHEQHLRFSASAAGELAQHVEIVDDRIGTLVATRIPQSRSPLGWPAAVIASVVLIGCGLVAWMGLARMGRARRSESIPAGMPPPLPERPGKHLPAATGRPPDARPR